MRLASRHSASLVTFDSAVETLCKAMMKQDNRRRVEMCTRAYVAGIEPLSSIFGAHWTASMFWSIVNNGAQTYQSILEAEREEMHFKMSRPYGQISINIL